MFLEMNEIGESQQSLDTPLDISEALRAGAGSDPVLLDGVREARFRGTAHKDGDAVLLQGRLTAGLELRCARCLRPVPRPLDVRVFLMCVETLPESTSGEVPADEQALARDASYYRVRDGRLDLTEVAGEQVLLHLPIKPLCREDCAGLCSLCGTDLNETRCDCRDATVDPRLAPLKALRERWGTDKTSAGGD